MPTQDYSEINPAWGDRRPVIVGFLCNWCSYRAADLAGTSRFGYPATLRDIRLMCTGRLDPTFVLKAPYSTRVTRLDETTAARKPILRWKPK